MTIRTSSRIAAIGAALIIGASGIAFAEPHGHRGHHGGHHGHHGGGDIVMAIAALKSELRLNTSQQGMWDNAVAAGKGAREAARANRRGVEETLKAELAKAEPDLAAVAASADAARTANASAHRQVRDAWLNLYSTFTPEQKAVVKNSIQQKLARIEQYREKMRQRHGG